MKQFFFSLFLLASLSVYAQEEDIQPAAKGVVYGSVPDTKGKPVTTDELPAKLVNNTYEGKVTGTVTEVCQAMGCWIKLQKSDGSTLMVKSKDHGFFMPQNLVGKTVLIEGTASVKEVTEQMRRHLAEDSGKSKEEINAIKGSEKQVQFVARGVKVLD